MGCESKYTANWDLTCLFKSSKDEAIDETKEAVEKSINDLKRLVTNLTTANLHEAIKKYEEAYTRITKLSVYASLYFQTRLKDEEATAFYQATNEWQGECFAQLSQFIVAIQGLDYEGIKKELENNEDLNKYKAFIEEIFRFKDHTLSTKEESIISRLGVTGGSLWHKFHEGLLTRIEFSLDGKALTLSDIVEESNFGKTEEIRKNASLSLSEGLEKNSYALLSVLNNIALSHKIFGDIKKYSSPESQRYIADNISQETVENMLTAITESYAPICHRYYKIKSKILGKAKLQYWDRCSHVRLSDAPEKKYTYDEAIDLVLKIFKNFSAKFYDIAYTMVTESWVDVYPRDGKVSGAFSCPLTSDLHPFILLNFYGSIRDVLTIAHEFGHGIHQKLSSNVNDLVSDPPLNISETASTFAEKMTHKYLLEQENDPKRKIELMCARLDDVMSTVFRQAAFFKFEQKIHKSRKEKELSLTTVNKFWREVLSESLGEAVELHPCINNFWGYITHFTSCPFYVYSYSFGCLFVEGLYSKYNEIGDRFISIYEEVLASGGTKTYSEIAGMFGLNANSKTFWQSALSSIEKEINDLENLCDLALRN